MGRHPAHRYYFEVRYLAFVILSEWERLHWGKTAWETKQRLLAYKRKLEELDKEFNHE